MKKRKIQAMCVFFSEDESPAGDGSGNEIFSRVLSDDSKSYRFHTYPDDKDTDTPISENRVTFKYSTMQNHAATSFFSIQPGLQGKRHFLLKLDFLIVANISCQWKILIQDAPCKAEVCIGDFMFVLGIQGLGQEKERFAEVCMGNSPAIGLEKACASIQSLVGQSRLLYGKRFDDFCEDVFGESGK